MASVLALNPQIKGSRDECVLTVVTDHTLGESEAFWGKHLLATF